nr:unnamed protein product [Callosobruchus analis]
MKATIPRNYNYNHEIITFERLKIISVKIILSNFKILNILAIYRTPSTSPYAFNRQLEDFLHKSKYAANQTSIIIGDINIDILADYDYAPDYLNILYSNGFRSFVNQYTRQFKNQNSCIDHIFIKSSVNAYAFKPIIYRHNVTDHYPIILQTNFDTKREENHPAKFKTYINYAKLYKHFSRELLRPSTRIMLVFVNPLSIHWRPDAYEM